MCDIYLFFNDLEGLSCGRPWFGITVARMTQPYVLKYNK